MGNLTNYPNGISSFGIPVLGGRPPSVFGNYWFVDAKTGADGAGRGKSPRKPFLTMAEAFSRIDSGDVIFFRGKVREQLTTPVGVFDVTIIGAGNAPRHADDHSETASPGRGSSAATWTAPASGSTAGALLRVQQQGWRLENFVMQISGDATICVEAFKNNDSGDDERDGGHLNLVNMRFVGDNDGVGFQRTGGNGYCRVLGCAFQNFADGIGHAAGGGGADGFQQIEDCWFESNVNHIDAPLYRSRILRNCFMTLASGTVEVDLTGGAANVVAYNQFLGGAFEDNVIGTGDIWYANWSVDAGATEIGDAAAAGAGTVIAAP